MNDSAELLHLFVTILLQILQFYIIFARMMQEIIYRPNLAYTM